MNVVLFFLLIFALACGRKGNPRPPEAIAPSSVRYLTATGEVGGILLTWEAPFMDNSGDELTDLAGFKIKRADFIPDETPDYETIGTVAAVRPPAPPEPTIETAPPPPPVDTPPVRYEYRDATAKPATRYVYVVVPFNDDGVEGAVTSLLRVTFSGETSVIEAL